MCHSLRNEKVFNLIVVCTECMKLVPSLYLNLHGMLEPELADFVYMGRGMLYIYIRGIACQYIVQNYTYLHAERSR